MSRDLRAGFFEPGSPSFATGLFRTPGYPAWLALLFRAFGGSVRAVIATQIVLGVFTVWLTHALALRLLGRRAAIAAALVLALDPATALYTSFLQPEALFTLLVVVGVHAWLSALEHAAAGPAAVAGAMLGLATLTRPIGLFLPLFLAPLAWIRRPPRRPAVLALCLVAAASLPVAGWTVKNLVLTGVPVFTSVGDSNLLHFRAAGALAHDEAISLDEARTRVWLRFWAGVPPGSSVAELSRRQRALGTEILREHPWGTIAVTAGGALRMAAGTGHTALAKLLGDPDPESVTAPWKRVVQALQVLVLAFAYLAALRGVILLGARRRVFELAVPLAVVAYFAVISAGPEANTRFRYPAMPFLAVLAGYGLSQRRGPVTTADCVGEAASPSAAVV